MTREIAPEIDIHISVQANTMNYATVKFWEVYQGNTRYPSQEK